MKTLAISTLTICGIDELPDNSAREVTHVLSVLDPDRAEIEAFGSYGAHRRVTLRFHDIIDPLPGQIMPAPEHVGEILRFGEDLRETARGRASGHLLVMPYRHVGDLEDLAADEATELWGAVRTAAVALKAAYRPDGLNVGANLGRAAGAGVPGHLHLHVLPRWGGDSNFVTSVAEARVLPEALPTTYERLRAAWPA